MGWDWDAIKTPGATPDPKLGYSADAFDWSKPVPGGPTARGFDYYFGNDLPNFPPYSARMIGFSRLTEPAKPKGSPAEGG